MRDRTSAKLSWSVKRLSNITIQLDIKMRRASDWEQYVLLTSDRHFDSTDSNRALQRLHLDQAKDRGAPVLDFGDLFDAMQGKYDKRSAKSDLDEGHKGNNYLNLLVKDAYEFFAPYADILALLAEGNHESGVYKHTEYNLIDGLLTHLANHGSPIMHGGYRGWIRFQFSESTYHTSRNAYYTHGYGGGGPVTRDVIQTNRKAVYVGNADYVFSGHTHDQWVMPIDRVRLLASGIEVPDRQYHVKLPTYKDEFYNKDSGFHHEKGRGPKPLGAWWLRFYWSSRANDLKAQFIEAET